MLGLLSDIQRNRITILKSLTVLRQMALHPGLVAPEHDKMACAKIDTLADQLRDVVAGGHRALVFSQFTSHLGLVREELERAGFTLQYLDGATPATFDKMRVRGRFEKALERALELFDLTGRDRRWEGVVGAVRALARRGREAVARGPAGAASSAVPSIAVESPFIVRLRAQSSGCRPRSAGCWCAASPGAGASRPTCSRSCRSSSRRCAR